MRRAYGSWKVKQALLVLSAIRHEKYGVDVPTITLPELAAEEDIDLATEMLSSLRAHEKSFMVLPYGFTFEWKGSTSGTGTIITETIEMMNRDIAYNMGCGFMLLGLTGKTGSYALAQTQTGQYEIQLESDARFICNTINLGSDGWSIIDRLVKFNYGEKANSPRLIARNMPTRNWASVLPVVHNLTISKHITPSKGTERFIRSVLAIPQLDEESEKRAEVARETPAPTVSSPKQQPEQLSLPLPVDENKNDNTQQDNTNAE
jgi:hypothetical protein